MDAETWMRDFFALPVDRLRHQWAGRWFQDACFFCAALILSSNGDILQRKRLWFDAWWTVRSTRT